MMYLIEYREILTQNNQLWVKRFEKRYTKPGDETKSGGWKARSSWMTDLNDVRNERQPRARRSAKRPLRS